MPDVITLGADPWGEVVIGTREDGAVLSLGCLENREMD